MKKAIRILAIYIIVFAAAIGITGCDTDEKSVDYSMADNWAVRENDAIESSVEEKAADVFFISPTAVSGDGIALNMNIEDEESRKSFLAATLMEKGIYDDNARFFAPFYRQATLSVYTMPEEQMEEALAYAYVDVREAFDYYMQNYNNGRPVVLAGFSQGADMVKRLMIDYGKNVRFNNLLVAAYMIGWNITDEELAAYPYIRMAEGEADTDVIVSFCTESEDITSSIIVPTSTHSINPLNWMCDETLADKSLNLGACMVDGRGEAVIEYPFFTGAYIDPVRGTLKVTDVNKDEFPPKLSFLDAGNYHIYDYMFFYRNLEKNVQTRIDQYASIHRVKMGGFAQNNLKNVKKLIGGDKAGLSEDTVDSGIMFAKTVTDEMCTPAYWLDKRDNIDKVILDADGIAAFNVAQIPEEHKLDSFYYYVGDDRVSELGRDELLMLLQIFDLPPKDTQLYYTDGTEVKDDFWEDLCKLRNLDAVKDVNAVRYGVALRNMGVRKGPTDTELAASEDYDYCDEMQNSSVRMNEALIILWESSDSKWYYVASPYCLGWVRQEDVGVTDDYNLWDEALNPEEFLIVTANHTYLDEDPSNAQISSRALDMGTKLALVTDGSYEGNNYNRYALNNYVIQLPCRDNSGKLYYEKAYLPQSIDVNQGYLEFTQRNVVELAFKSLGEQYGWAGLYNNRDCSQYMKEVYKCFGIDLPRNTSSMMGIPWTSINTDNLSSERKAEILNSMPAGSLLIFPGHVMMYLGEENGEYYCISATGSMKIDKDGDVVRVRSVLVNSLCSTWRGSGKTWLESIKAIKLPY